MRRRREEEHPSPLDARRPGRSVHVAKFATGVAEEEPPTAPGRSPARMHDRLTAPYSLAQDEHFAREGWSWRFPADASTATIVGKDCH